MLPHIKHTTPKSRFVLSDDENDDCRDEHDNEHNDHVEVVDSGEEENEASDNEQEKKCPKTKKENCEQLELEEEHEKTFKNESDEDDDEEDDEDDDDDDSQDDENYVDKIVDEDDLDYPDSIHRSKKVKDENQAFHDEDDGEEDDAEMFSSDDANEVEEISKQQFYKLYKRYRARLSEEREAATAATAANIRRLSRLTPWSFSKGLAIGKQIGSTNWGRGIPKWLWFHSIGSAFLMLFCPVFALLMLYSTHFHDGQISLTLQYMVNDPKQFLAAISNYLFPENVTYVEAIRMVAVWYWIQLCFYFCLSAKPVASNPTPSGKVINYKHINGFRAALFSLILFMTAVFYDLIDATRLLDYWPVLYVIQNVFGFALTLFAYVKARCFPSTTTDLTFSGSFFYDLMMGIELNPSFGSFDFKLFFNGRPGIGAWCIINFAFALNHFQKFHSFDDAFLLLIIIQAFYVFAFFWLEDWYVKTIDMAFDHFGFYLAWGDSVWLPFTYTLQGYYLATHSVQLPTGWFAFMCGAAALAMFVFLHSNLQKEYFRNSSNARGKSATYIGAKYRTLDGVERHNLLVTCGWWGVVRHANYTADLLLSLVACMCCGSPWQHITPYYYFIYMTILLVHRCQRDENKCSKKYGKYWQEYVEKVPYRLIPFVY